MLKLCKENFFKLSNINIGLKSPVSIGSPDKNMSLSKFLLPRFRSAFCGGGKKPAWNNKSQKMVKMLITAVQGDVLKREWDKLAARLGGGTLSALLMHPCFVPAWHHPTGPDEDFLPPRSSYKNLTVTNFMPLSDWKTSRRQRCRTVICSTTALNQV